MQVASAIESGVAQAAALATSMSADELAIELHECKQRALQSSPALTPRSPAGVPHKFAPSVPYILSRVYPTFGTRHCLALAWQSSTCLRRLRPLADI